jgi:hypothetical protein
MTSSYAREARLYDLIAELDAALVIIRGYGTNDDEDEFRGALGHVEYVIEQAANFLNDLRLQRTTA